MTGSLAKVRFELDPSDWHGHGSETLWATPMIAAERKALFRIDNSPFFAVSINNGDVVEASPTGSSMNNAAVLSFKIVVERGGHSTYMIIANSDEARVMSYWTQLEGAGCSYESGRIRLSIGQRLLLSVDVPPSADIHAVYALLQRGEKDGVWMFQEGYAHLRDAKPQ